MHVSYNNRTRGKDYYTTRATLICLICLALRRILLWPQNWRNIGFLGIVNYKITLQWYSPQTLQATRLHVWDHRFYDLQRIARYAHIPPLTHKIVRHPVHNYITLPKVSVTCSSFIKACCTLCIASLKHRSLIPVGVYISRRKDDMVGNFVIMARCTLTQCMSPDRICSELCNAVSSCEQPVKVSLVEFLSDQNRLIFNNWRNIETFNQRAPHLRLLSKESRTFTNTIPQHVAMSHDGVGWYILY
jgi:hypothetical protein